MIPTISVFNAFLGSLYIAKEAIFQAEYLQMSQLVPPSYLVKKLGIMINFNPI